MMATGPVTLAAPSDVAGAVSVHDQEVRSRLATSCRQATVAEAEAVSEVYLASRQAFVPCAPLAHADHDVRAWIRDPLIPMGRVTVVIQDGDVVAMMALSDDGTVGWIEQL